MPIVPIIPGVDERVVLVSGVDGSPVGTAASPLPVSTVAGGGTVSTLNSTATPLAGGASFTGTGEDVSSYGLIKVNIFADQIPATSGIKLESSKDNVNWDTISEDPGLDFAAAAINHGMTFALVPAAQYFRVVYTNGATPQTVFRLQTIYKTSGIPEAYRIYNAALSSFQYIRSANSLGDNIGGGTQPAFVAYLKNAAGNFDGFRNNQDVIVQASAVTGISTINTDITNFNAQVFVAHANVSSYGAAGTFLMKLQFEDANGLFVDIPGATTGVLATGADLLLVVGARPWPADTATAFYSNFPLPRRIRLVETIGVNSVTFSSAFFAGGF